MPTAASVGTRSPNSTRPKIASHIGTSPISSAAIPVAMVCSPHATRPVPPRSSSAPTMDASRTWTAGWPGDGAPGVEQDTAAHSRRPAGTKRRNPITKGGRVSMASFMPRYVEPQTT